MTTMKRPGVQELRAVPRRDHALRGVPRRDSLRSLGAQGRCRRRVTTSQTQAA
jgi:hypothetical protein